MIQLNFVNIGVRIEELQKDILMLVKIASSMSKEAGWLSDTGDIISRGLFNSGKKDLANISQMRVTDAAKNVGSAIKGAISPQGFTKAVTPFTHVLKDGTKITADQFAHLGENAKMYAQKL